jgi:hypothetical protein
MYQNFMPWKQTKKEKLKSFVFGLCVGLFIGYVVGMTVLWVIMP